MTAVEPAAEAADRIGSATVVARVNEASPTEAVAASWTTSAVTMPNIPSWPSAWGRMWQWNAHAPGSSAVTITSQRSPGLTPSVSAKNDAEPSG